MCISTKFEIQGPFSVRKVSSYLGSVGQMCINHGMVSPCHKSPIMRWPFYCHISFQVKNYVLQVGVIFHKSGILVCNWSPWYSKGTPIPITTIHSTLWKFQTYKTRKSSLLWSTVVMRMIKTAIAVVKGKSLHIQKKTNIGHTRKNGKSKLTTTNSIITRVDVISDFIGHLSYLSWSSLLSFL